MYFRVIPSSSFVSHLQGRLASSELPYPTPPVGLSIKPCPPPLLKHQVPRALAVQFPYSSLAHLKTARVGIKTKILQSDQSRTTIRFQFLFFISLHFIFWSTSDYNWPNNILQSTISVAWGQSGWITIKCSSKQTSQSSAIRSLR